MAMKNTFEYRNQVSWAFMMSGAVPLILMMSHMHDMHNIALFNPGHLSDGMIFAAMTISGAVLLAMLMLPFIILL